MATKKKTSKRKKAKTKTSPRTTKKTTAPRAEPAEKSIARSGSAEDRMRAPLEEFERLVGQLRSLRPSSWDWPTFPEMRSTFKTRFPSIDVVNREKEIVVKAEVPGIDKEDIDISLSGRTLTIKGESRHEEEKEEGDVHRREIRSGSFSRVVTLPDAVDASKAKSSYKDGVVELKLPKPRRSKKHSIRIG